MEPMMAACACNVAIAIHCTFPCTLEIKQLLTGYCSHGIALLIATLSLPGLSVNKQGIPRLSREAQVEVLGTVANAIGTIIASPLSDESRRSKRHASGLFGSTLLYYALADGKYGRKETYAELCERIQPHLEGL